MADQAELKAALAEAVAESGYDAGDSDVEKSWDEWDKEGAPAAPVDEPSKETAPDTVEADD